MMGLAVVATVLQATNTAAEQGLTTFSISFMLISMGIVTSVMLWAYSRILRTKRHFDPDGTGPAQPPVPGKVDPDADI